MLNRVLVFFDRLILGIFYREIEVVGVENLAAEGPLLIAANHGNSLVDPGLVFGFLPRPGRFLAKSTLWRHPVAKYLVRMAGAIPVYRRQDAGSDTTKNEQTFARCHEVLAQGGVIAIFPEGASHVEPALLPLRTGVSRIALEAERRFGPLGLEIVPVGLNFEERDRFRSRVLIRVGRGIDPAPEVELHGEQERDAVRRLTERVEEGLRAVTLNYDSWREAEVVDCAAQVYARPAADAPTRERMDSAFALRKAFLSGYRELRKTHPEVVHAVYEATDDYDRLLRDLRLEDRQVAASYSKGLVARFTLRALWSLTIWRPIAFLGLVLNWLPYRIPGWVVQAIGVKKDVRATYKLLIGAALLPLAWIAEALFAGWKLGPLVGAVVLVLAPLSGYFALLYRDTWQAFREEAAAYLRLKGRRRAAAVVKERRRAVYEQVSHLVEVYQENR